MTISIFGTGKYVFYRPSDSFYAETDAYGFAKLADLLLAGQKPEPVDIFVRQYPERHPPVMWVVPEKFHGKRAVTVAGCNLGGILIYSFATYSESEPQPPSDERGAEIATGRLRKRLQEMGL